MYILLLLILKLPTQTRLRKLFQAFSHIGVEGRKKIKIMMENACLLLQDHTKCFNFFS